MVPRGSARGGLPETSVNRIREHPRAQAASWLAHERGVPRLERRRRDVARTQRPRFPTCQPSRSMTRLPGARRWRWSWVTHGRASGCWTRECPFDFTADARAVSRSFSPLPTAAHHRAPSRRRPGMGMASSSRRPGLERPDRSIHVRDGASGAEISINGCGRQVRSVGFAAPQRGHQSRGLGSPLLISGRFSQCACALQVAEAVAAADAWPPAAVPVGFPGQVTFPASAAAGAPAGRM